MNQQIPFIPGPFPLGVFITVRYRLGGRLHEQLGCEPVAGPVWSGIKTDDATQTSVAGVFAAGDMARTAHSAILAAADGFVAGAAAHRSIALPEPSPLPHPLPDERSHS